MPFPTIAANLRKRPRPQLHGFKDSERRLHFSDRSLKRLERVQEKRMDVNWAARPKWESTRTLEGRPARLLESHSGSQKGSMTLEFLGMLAGVAGILLLGAVYGYWIGTAANRRSWSGKKIKRVAGLPPALLGIVQLRPSFPTFSTITMQSQIRCGRSSPGSSGPSCRSSRCLSRLECF